MQPKRTRRPAPPRLRQGGLLEPGALADLLIVDGNPLDDVRVLEDEKNLRVIIKDGRFYKE